MSRAPGKALAGANPVTLLYGAAFFMLSALIVYRLSYNLISLLALFSAALATGRLKTLAAALAKTMLPLFLMIFILQSLFYGGASAVLFRYGFLCVKVQGVLNAALLSTLLLVIGGFFTLLFRLCEPRALTVALEARGLPPKASYIFLSTFSLIAQMKLRLSSILDAQRSRGIETQGSLPTRVRAFFPILLPLVLTAILETGDRALLLESRGFSAPGVRTRLRVPASTRADRFFQRVFPILLILIIAGRVLLWIL